MLSKKEKVGLSNRKPISKGPLAPAEGQAPSVSSKVSLLVGKPGAQDRNGDFLHLVNALCALYLEGAENIGFSKIKE